MAPYLMEVKHLELKSINKGNGDSGKTRVLIEFNKGTYEYDVLKEAQKRNLTVAGTLKEDVGLLVREMGEAMGMANPDANDE